MTDPVAPAGSAVDPLAGARQAKADLRARYGDDPRVRGIGIEARPDGFGIRVLVRDPLTLAELAIPEVVEGLPVTVVAIGDVQAEA